ncbi:C40 family peptidase [Flavobacterium psychrotrophum]|uniref:C40 family peptidase n=1 Tax=Flavobacterium psychrotrophum TaxID=2294119 RepID=UPI0013C507F2|nr:C40 family peptidase [Flavobacterium psychrotrophum]
MKQLQFLPFTLLLLLTSMGAMAQSVTSKDDAQKYASGNDVALATEKVVFLDDDVVAYNAPAPEKTKGGPNKPADNPKKKKKKIVVIDEPAEADFVAEPTENYLARQIVNNAMQFEGVRYRGGGTTTAGMDCSGMVYATFQIFDITLPRSSASMAVGAGHEIKLEDAKPGDLLFFDNNRRHRGINHVGLVTEVTADGEVKFIHSSTSHGVMVSSMNEAYHSRTFIQANRVIEDEPAPAL